MIPNGDTGTVGKLPRTHTNKIKANTQCALSQAIAAVQEDAGSDKERNTRRSADKKTALRRALTAILFSSRALVVSVSLLY